MSQISIQVIQGGITQAVEHGEDEVNLVYTREYQEGDRIAIEIEDGPSFYWVQLDEAKGKSLVYLTGNYSYRIPFGEKRINLSPKAFSGSRHLISVRKAREFEYRNYRNLALNVNDQHGDPSCYPHASANVETRGEAVFAAANAIDGVTVSNCHGRWPYESWGINQQEDAYLKLEFGRTVNIDRIILYTRADYPHDNWWKNCTITASDGSVMELALVKTGTAQEFVFEEKQVEWLELGRLIKAEGPSPFPALVQIEVYGRE